MALTSCSRHATPHTPGTTRGSTYRGTPGSPLFLSGGYRVNIFMIHGHQILLFKQQTWLRERAHATYEAVIAYINENQIEPSRHLNFARSIHRSSRVDLFAFWLEGRH